MLEILKFVLMALGSVFLGLITFGIICVYIDYRRLQFEERVSQIVQAILAEKKAKATRKGGVK